MKTYPQSRRDESGSPKPFASLPRHRIEACWVQAIVDGSFDADPKGNPRQLALTIKGVDGGKPELKALKSFLFNKNPYFEFGSMPFICNEITLVPRGNGFHAIGLIKGGRLDHKPMAGDEIVVMCSFDPDASETITLGLTLNAWNYAKVYQKHRNEMTRLNNQEAKRQDAIESVTSVRRRAPVRLMYEGRMVHIATLDEWSRFFEYKGWPDDVQLQICINGKFTAENIEMFHEPAIKGPRPDWRNVILNEMYESVKDRDPIKATARATDDDSGVDLENVRRFREENKPHEPKQPRPQKIGTLADILPADVLVQKDPKKSKKPEGKQAPGPQNPTRSQRRATKPKAADLAAANERADAAKNGKPAETAEAA